MNIEWKDLIVFDVDWVIIDTVPLMINGVRQICEQMNLWKSEAFYREHASNPHLAKFLFPDSPEMQKESERIYFESFEEDTHIPELIDWSLETLSELSNEKLIALFSSKIKKDIDRAMKHHSIYEFINSTIGRQCVSKNKPHPEWLFLLMEQYKLTADKVIMIWDSESDYVAAKWANVDFLGVNSWVFTKKDWDDRWIDNVESIKDFI